MNTEQTIAVVLFAGALIAAIAAGSYILGSRTGRWK